MQWAGILALNNYDLTRQTVEDLLNQDVPTSVIVWDNGSTDGTTERLYEDFRDKNLVVVRSHSNIGVGPGWDQLCAISFGGAVASTDALLICNNDIRLRPDTLRTLLAQEGGFITPINVGSMEKMLSHDPEKFPVNPLFKGGPDFSCFLLKKWFYEAIGGFPKCYPMAYFEDRDFHMQAIGKGLGDQIFSVQFPYYHIGSQTIKNNPDIAKQNSVQFEINKQTFIRRWGGPPHYETRTTPND